ncbi:hypothetical protein [Streptomyces sp. NPDC094032]|uniref:hypothetical protein n=1 Tax=Streptomyces sp. NPDC094032 TaxID=3155308 RepID=UPI00331CB5DD
MKRWTACAAVAVGVTGLAVDGIRRLIELRRLRADPDLEPALPLRTGITRTTSLLLASALLAVSLTGCALLDLARTCEGTDARVAELAALDILDSRPDEAAVARGFEKVDAGCWADSGDVVVYAGRTYAFPGTRDEVATHYRTVALRDGWSPGREASPSDDLCFTKDAMSLQVVFPTAGAGYSINVDSYVNSGAVSGC